MRHLAVVVCLVGLSGCAHKYTNPGTPNGLHVGVAKVYGTKF